MESDSYKDLVRLIESAPEFVDEYGDIVKAIPYAKHVIAAYKWARSYRIKRFLRSLNVATEELNENQKGKFKRYIESEAAAELLAEYTDIVLRTSSKTAIAALGILCTDRSLGRAGALVGPS